MAAPKLTPQQQDEVIKMLAARETHATIAKKLEIGITAVEYYAKNYRSKIEKARQKRDEGLINKGLRTVEKRVEVLEGVADMLLAELTEEAAEKRESAGPLWVRDYRLSKDYCKEIQVFAGGIVSELRGVLNDIAKEMGHRTNKTELSGPDGQPLKGYVTISPDDWDVADKPKSEPGQGSSDDGA